MPYLISAVGVDLGTTFSVVGVNKNGKVVIIEDKAGHKIFPSIVSYLDNGGKFVAAFFFSSQLVVSSDPGDRALTSFISRHLPNRD
jgi:molecular chaperone DnaK (HSP70)